MDYLDPKKERRHSILLWIGYLFISVAILTGTLVLVYLANGFGLKNGTVIQNGLTFFSSHPSPANIYLDGKRNKVQTNSRLVLPAGVYHVRLTRDGYRDWQRTIEVGGGDVQHFDYPFLFPQTMTAKPIDSYDGTPGLITQSPDRRWVLVQQPNAPTQFAVYDLKNAKPVKLPALITLPETIVSKGTTSQWLLGEWADDNKHVVLQHIYDGKKEYLLVDRENPEKSLNLNTTLGVEPTKLTLSDKKYDRYYLYDGATGALKSASLDAPTPVVRLERVLAYQTYGQNTILYATDAEAPAGKVLVKLRDGDKTYDLRSMSVGSNYLLDLTKYSGVLYAAMGSDAQSRLYVYKDPIGQLTEQRLPALVPLQVMHVDHPDYLSFSASAQFVVAEHGNEFGVYDFEAKKGYNYRTTQPLDAGQAHATWMDGNRLTYVSGGKNLVFDYDYANQQVLTDQKASFLPMFAGSYAYMYTVTDNSKGGVVLSQVPLRAPADL